MTFRSDIYTQLNDFQASGAPSERDDQPVGEIRVGLTKLQRR